MWDTTIVTHSSDAVRLELDRVLTSSTFTGSPRLSRFLRFVVERTLAGEGERLKEYVIGVEVFDRDGEYDPRVDSIVRVEAGRLRTKLEEYYQRAGAADPVIISIQRGGYAPDFRRATRPNGGAQDRSPTATVSIARGDDRSRARDRCAHGVERGARFARADVATAYRRAAVRHDGERSGCARPRHSSHRGRHREARERWELQRRLEPERSKLRWQR